MKGKRAAGRIGLSKNRLPISTTITDVNESEITQSSVMRHAEFISASPDYSCHPSFETRDDSYNQGIPNQVRNDVSEWRHVALINWAKSAGEAEDYRDNLSSQCIHPVGIGTRDRKSQGGGLQNGFPYAHLCHHQRGKKTLGQRSPEWGASNSKMCPNWTVGYGMVQKITLTQFVNGINTIRSEIYRHPDFTFSIIYRNFVLDIKSWRSCLSLFLFCFSPGP